MTLDDKLREIATNTFYKGATKGLEFPKIAKPDGTYLDGVIAQIKAVFSDEGYVQLAYNPVKKTVAGKPIDEVLKTNDTHMTGQEWYDAFIKALENSVDVNRRTQDFTDAVLVAKHAAGLQDA